MPLFQSLLQYTTSIGHRGFSAGSTLLVAVMAGRELDPSTFGQFAIMMAIVALVLMLHASMFSEPMLVYGAREYVESLQQYLSKLTYGQLAFTILTATLTGLVALAWFDAEVALLFAVAIVLALSMDFQERSFFMQLRPEIPLTSSMFQFCTLVFLLFVWPDATTLHLKNFLEYYVFSLLIANFTLFAFHILAWSRFGTGVVRTSIVAKRHLRFAVRTLAAHILLFSVTNIYIFILPSLHDLASTANFRAQSAIIGPGVQAFSALGVISIPMLRACSQKAAFTNRLASLLGIITFTGILLLFIVGVWGHDILTLIYGGQYGLTRTGYWLAGLYPLTIGYAFMLGSALRAIDRTGLVARCTGAATMICLPTGLWLTYYFGEEGAILAQVVGSLTVAGFSAFALTKCLKQMSYWG